MDKFNNKSQEPPPMPWEWQWYPHLTKIEPETCRDFSFGRLAVRLERTYRQQHKLTRYNPEQWLEDRIIAIRCNWGIDEFKTEVRGNPLWFSYPPTRTMITWIEWPDTPYIKINPALRLSRIEPFLPGLTQEEKQAEQEYLRDPHNPLRPVPPSLAKRLTELDWMLNPLNHSTGKKRVLELAFPENSTHEQLVEQFRAVLKTEFPQQGQPYLKSGGRGSEQASIIDDLNGLAIYWLRKIAKLRRADIPPLVKHPLSGRQVIEDEKNLDSPLGRIIKGRNDNPFSKIIFREPLDYFPCVRTERREVPKDPSGLQKFAWDAFGNLEPLEPLDLSEPDFSTL